MNIKWKIEKVDVLSNHSLFADVIKNIHWTVIASDDTFKTELSGTTTIEAPSQTNGSMTTSNHPSYEEGLDVSNIYVSFKDVSLDHCLSWIGNDKDFGEASVTSELDKVKTVGVLSKSVSFD